MAIITDPSTGIDTVPGTNSDDTFIWRGGDDTYLGGEGNDTLFLEDPTATNWTLGSELISGYFTGSPSVTLSLSSIETFEFVANPLSGSSQFGVFGTQAAERLVINAMADTKYVVYSREGDDTLIARGSGATFIDSIAVPSLIGGNGDDLFKIELDSGGVAISGGDGTDRLVVDALFADVTVQVDDPTATTPDTATRLFWDGKAVSFQGTVEFVEFADLQPDGSPLVVRYEDLEQPQPITGTNAAEVIRGTLADNDIQALGGNDWITLLGGDDTVDGGDGTDMLSFVEHRYTGLSIRLSDGFTAIDARDTITVTNIENVTGTSFKDSFEGDEGANWFRGLGGSDTFHASAGADLINGGAGSDLYSNTFSGISDDVNVSLLRGRVWDGFGEGTRLVNIEHLRGGIGDDTLTGNHGNNLLYGNAGDDVIMGNGGNDIINGQQGMDTAVYGFDRDAYSVTTGPNIAGESVVFVEYIGAGSGDGRDTLASIEVLRFADGDVIL